MVPMHEEDQWKMCQLPVSLDPSALLHLHHRSRGNDIL